MLTKRKLLVAVFAAVAAVALQAAPASASGPPIRTYGPFHIVLDNGLCLDVPGGNKANGVKVQQWNCWGGPMQTWYLEWMDTGADWHLYRIRNAASNKCLDVPGGNLAEGVEVQQWDCWGAGISSGEMQIWTFPDHYHGEIVNRATRLCLDDPNGSTAWGTVIRQWKCNTSAAQHWSVTTGLTPRSPEMFYP